MDGRESPFKYRLASLLKVDQWEGRLLGLELRRARQVIEEHQRLHRETLEKIATGEHDMRELHRDEAQIPIERRQRLSVWLQEQYTQARARRDAIADSERLFEQIMAQRQAKQQKIRALENHRGRERRVHDVEQLRAGLREADERWLNKRGDRK